RLRDEISDLKRELKAMV
ncbi:MAG: hypothetical protein ACRDIU_10365, partial [Actinomycetota bacterium]